MRRPLDNVSNLVDTESMRTIECLIRTNAQRDPDSACIVSETGDLLTWRQLAEQLEQTHSALRAFGFGPDDRIAVVLPNGPSLAAVFLTVAACAACAPLNPAYGLDEFTFYLSDLRAQALIASEDTVEAAKYAALRLGIPVLDIQAANDVPGLFSLRGDSPAGKHATGSVGSDHVALLLHTSGTTSRPKLVPLRHGNLIASAYNTAGALELSHSDRCLNLMPLFHIHGLVGGLLAPLVAGGSAVCPPSIRPGNFFPWLKRTQPTWYTAVPTMHRLVVAEAAAQEEAIQRSRLRFIRSSSSALPPALFEKLHRVFRVPVLEAYSMTEAAHQITCNPLPPGKQQPGTVGLPAGSAVAIVDDSGLPLPTGQSGEIVIRGPAVMSAYEATPETNAEAFVNGWFRTGDLGRLNADGYLVLTGRLKEQINRGGEKISPLEIDQVLLNHPDVLEAAAFGIPHPTLGEDIAAAVVVRAQSKLALPELRTYLGERLAPFKIPRRILIVDAIQKGPTGKIQRRQLAKALGLDASELRRERTTSQGTVTPLERELLKLWRRMLRCDSLYLDEDFFERGGDSLLAVQMLLEVEKMTKRPVPETIVFECPTVRQLAREISKLGSSHASPAAHIHPKGNQQPLFFFHGDYTGRGFYTRLLARHLGQDQPFISVAPHGLAQEPVPASFEQMASERLPLLLSIQPHGPYRLGGYCSGAMVALEVARLLIHAGHQVELVAMVDSPTLNLRPTMRFLHRRVARFTAISGKGSGLGAAMDAGWRCLTEIERMSLSSITRYAATSGRNLKRRVSTFLTENTAAADPMQRTSNLAAELGRRDRELGRTYSCLYRHYFPEKIDVPIVYFAASYRGTPVYSLSPRVEIVNVPGGHFGCITKDIEVLASHLRKRLERLSAPERLPMSAQAPPFARP